MGIPLEVWLQLLWIVALVVLITVLPVMLAAKWAGARRNGFVHALAAVVLATAIGQLAMVASLAIASGMELGMLAALGAGLAVYALVLGTSFVTAIGIAVVATLLQIGIVMLLPELGLDTPFHLSSTL